MNEKFTFNNDNNNNDLVTYIAPYENVLERSLEILTEWVYTKTIILFNLGKYSAATHLDFKEQLLIVTLSNFILQKKIR